MMGYLPGYLAELTIHFSYPQIILKLNTVLYAIPLQISDGELRKLSMHTHRPPGKGSATP